MDDIQDGKPHLLKKVCHLNNGVFPNVPHVANSFQVTILTVDVGAQPSFTDDTNDLGERKSVGSTE